MAVKTRIENNCVGCPDGCRNCGLDHTEVTYHVCDECDTEDGPLYSYDGCDYCRTHLIEALKSSIDSMTADEVMDLLGISDDDLINYTVDSDYVEEIEDD